MCFPHGIIIAAQFVGSFKQAKGPASLTKLSISRVD